MSNDAATLAPRQPTGVRGQRSAAGTAALHWDAVPGATAYRVYFDFPDDDQGAGGWEWLPYLGVEVTVTAATATVSGLPTPPATWGLRVSALSGGRESVRAGGPGGFHRGGAAHTWVAHGSDRGPRGGQPNAAQLDGARGSRHAAPHGLPD